MKLYTHPPPHPGLVFLYNLKLDVAGLGGYCPLVACVAGGRACWRGGGLEGGGLRAEARANRCARLPGAAQLPAVGSGSAPRTLQDTGPRGLFRGAGGESGRKAAFSSHPPPDIPVS